MCIIYSVAILGQVFQAICCPAQLLLTCPAQVLQLETMYRADIVKFVQGQIDQQRDGKIAPITAMNAIVEKLLDAKICRVEKNMDVQKVMCHPFNRGKLGLNAFNVHRNGSRMFQVGCDPAEIVKFAVFELQPENPQKSSHSIARYHAPSVSKNTMQ